MFCLAANILTYFICFCNTLNGTFRKYSKYRYHKNDFSVEIWCNHGIDDVKYDDGVDFDSEDNIKGNYVFTKKFKNPKLLYVYKVNWKE